MRTEGDERALVRAAQGGDRRAFGAAFERQRPALLALCRRVLGDPALAEDAVQETALQALDHLGQLRCPERFGPWLWSIGLRLSRRWSLERARQGRSWQALEEVGRAPDPDEAAADPLERAELAELAARVRRAVAALPSGQRDATLLFYLAGLSHSEVAEELAIEVGAVKTRLHKARQALRRPLAPLWAEQAAAGVSGRRAELRLRPMSGRARFEARLAA